MKDVSSEMQTMTPKTKKNIVKSTPTDVINPKRIIGSISLNRKVRKLIAVVIDVRIIAFPILFILVKK